MSSNIDRELFESFWKKKGAYLKIKNADRLRENLGKKIEELRTIEELDLYVCSLKTGRENTRQVVVQFYDYLTEYAGFTKLNTCLYDKRFYDYPFERQLEIAKFLHEPKSPSEIQEKFDIDERTMRKDLQELEEGITVLGSTIKIEKDKKGRKYYYKTTLHPVFLPLNLTEVYAMTVYLDKVVARNDVNATLLQNIAQRIKNQLSDYAYDKLFPDEKRYLFANNYMNDEILAMQREGILMYLMKSGVTCKFTWNKESYYGRVVHEGDQYRILLHDGHYLEADIKDVEFVIESLEYQ